MTQLAGKHALITGGLGCIGQAMVQVFAGAGARVTVLDRPALDATALPNGTGWLGVDLNDLAGAQMRAGAAGRFDILVNNAALSSIGHFRTSALKTTKSNCASKNWCGWGLVVASSKLAATRRNDLKPHGSR